MSPSGPQDRERLEVGLVKLLGIRVEDASGDRVVLTCPVTPDLHQPFGLVHGGVHAALAETAASVGGALWFGDRGVVVGVSNHTDFLRAVREQVRFNRPHTRLHFMGRYFAWQGYLGRKAKTEDERRTHAPLIELCRRERARRRARVAEAAQIPANHPILDRIEALPRERFVPFDEVAASVLDAAVDLDGSGLATLSAMHAYARSFTLLEVGPGDRVVDLGAGTGYGSALLAGIVGPSGSVLAVEIDAELVARGRDIHASLANQDAQAPVRWVSADACDPGSWGLADEELGALDKLTVGFALERIPPAWAETLPEGVVIVAPLRDAEGELRLSRLRLRGGEFTLERFEAVAYVPTRSSPLNEGGEARRASP